MNAWTHWLDERTGLVSMAREWLDAPVPGGASLRRVWPAAIAMAFVVQLTTGFFLWLFYSPSAQTAWESVYFVQYQVAGGWLLRAMHHGSAQVLLVLLVIYLLQMITTGTYRAPREFVFWTALGMALVTLGLLLTGDLLAWDQNSLASTQTRVGYLHLLPGIGDGLYKLAAGGPQFGHLALSRFLGLHIACLAGGFALLLAAHVVLLRRADRAETADDKAASAGATAGLSSSVSPETSHGTAGQASSGTHFQRAASYWPDQALRNALAAVVVVAVVLGFALAGGISGERRGVELGSPGNAVESFAAARPEWAFRGLYQFAQLFPGGPLEILPVFVIPGLIVLFTLAMPWMARWRLGHRCNQAFVAVLLLGLVGLSVHSLAIDRDDPEHQAALTSEVERARRTVELAQMKGIPPTGALTLLRDDPKTQGPILFQTHCSSCHPWLDAEGRGIPSETPSAPNLHGYATREWVAGWLDPKTIAGPDYFGETKFLAGSMVQTVRVLHDDLDAEELAQVKDELDAIAAALSAEAQLKSQRDRDARDEATIARGRDLLYEVGCLDCHRFRDKGPLGVAPDQTGYGSREWTAAIIADPTARRFYGDRNDRMPAYAPAVDDPGQNILSPRDVELLTDWLRGEWDESR